MARRGKSKGSRRHPKLNVVHTRAAGIDVGLTFHVVAVPPEPVQTFQSFTGDLYRLADWLVEMGVTTVAMESTGIYWIPVFDILEAHGLEVLLVNARHAKNVPGRKTDGHDAQWLQQLHSYGLLRGSFHPAWRLCKMTTYPWRPSPQRVTRRAGKATNGLEACWRVWHGHESVADRKTFHIVAHVGSQQ